MITAAQLLERIHGQPCPWWQAAGQPVPPPDWTDPAELFGEIGRMMTEAGEPVLHYLEVGSWLGGSALKAAAAFPAAVVTCVDTWFGAAEHWTDTQNDSHDLRRGPDGQPHVYEAFAANVLAAGLRDRVAPIRLPSTIAAEVLAHHEITADVIYLDASHSYADVLADCRAWWPRANRWLVGDDWSDPRFGVAPAVLDFMRIEKIDPRRLQIIGGIFWAITKG